MCGKKSDIMFEDYRFISHNDIESSGLDPMFNALISWACVVEDTETGKIHEFYEECRPDFLVPNYECPHMKGFIKEPWNQDAERVHGFDWKSIGKKQHPTDLAIKFTKFIAPFLKHQKKIPFVYHANAEFDWRFIKSFMLRQDDKLYWAFYRIFSNELRLDTMKLVRDYVSTNKSQLKLIKQNEDKINKPRKRAASKKHLEKWHKELEEAKSAMKGRSMLTSYALDKICEHYGIEHNHHNALSDAKVLVPIRKIFTENMSLEQTA